MEIIEINLIWFAWGKICRSEKINNINNKVFGFLPEEDFYIFIYWSLDPITYIWGEKYACLEV